MNTTNPKTPKKINCIADFDISNIEVIIIRKVIPKDGNDVEGFGKLL